MRFDEIRLRGQAMGMTPFEEMGKGEMIRAIRLAESSRDCFGNFLRFACLEFDCCWPEDCLTLDSVDLTDFLAN